MYVASSFHLALDRVLFCDYLYVVCVNTFTNVAILSFK